MNYIKTYLGGANSLGKYKEIPAELHSFVNEYKIIPLTGIKVWDNTNTLGSAKAL